MGPIRIAFVLTALCVVAASAAGAQRPGAPKKAPPLAQPKERPPEAASGARSGETPSRVPVAGLRGAPSHDEENEGAERDAAFDFTARLKHGRRLPAGSTASGATSALRRVAEHPRREDLARWLEDSLRDREIDVALLGGHKYMINDCLGVKASAGEFRLKLANPDVRVENSGLVLTFEIEHVSLSAFKIRIRPNPNPLELCKFGKKFEVGGSMEDVRLTLRFDPLYDFERCRIGGWGDANPEVRIGNLNLKPLQNDLDRMAKNMVEDALTFALQMTVDGVISGIGDLVLSSLDQFLEADCPTKPGESGRATDRLGGAIGSKASGGRGSGSTAPASTADGAAGGTGQVEALLARIAELEARVAELETCGAPSGDLRTLLGHVLERLKAFDPAELSGAELRGWLAELLTLTLARAELAAPSTLLEPLTRFLAEPVVAPASDASGAARGPSFLVPNPELKGRMGRIVVRFPDAEQAGSTQVALQRDGKKVADTYGEATWELMAGSHDVQIQRVLLSGLEVRAGHDTVVRTGTLVVELTSDAQVRLYRKGGEEKLSDCYGTFAVGLPVGEYEVEIHGQRAPVTVREGEVTRF